jgi:membrane-associated protease RseP (regulator of RpoE activity)
MYDDVRVPLPLIAKQIEREVGDLFAVESVTLGIPEQPEAILLRGQLRIPSHQAYPLIADRLRNMDYTAQIGRAADHDQDELLAVPGVVTQEEPSRLRVQALLFGATVLTTLYVGAGMSEARPPDDLWWPLFNLWTGWPFALSLLSILLAHELGHYFVSRRHGMPATLPYFIPVPLPEFMNVLGTMGAVIFMKGRTASRRVMLDIGAAGPLIGLLVAIPVVALGLTLSHIEPLPVGQAYTMEGNSLLYLLTKYAVFGRWLPSDGVDVFIHPVAFAGWAGLLVTSLNLMPAGQLDGGHVVYSLLGPRAHRLTWPIIIALAAMGLLVWSGWFLWAGLIFFFGRGHPGPLDSITELDTKRKLTAVTVLVVFVLTFTPVPLTIVIPEGAADSASSGTFFLVTALAGLGWLRRRMMLTLRRR